MRINVENFRVTKTRQVNKTSRFQPITISTSKNNITYTYINFFDDHHLKSRWLIYISVKNVAGNKNWKYSLAYFFCYSQILKRKTFARLCKFQGYFLYNVFKFVKKYIHFLLLTWLKIISHKKYVALIIII